MINYRLRETQVDEIDLCFTYHAPFKGQSERYEAIREQAKNLAQQILRSTPASREQSLALTKIEEAVMFANAAIARREKEAALGILRSHVFVHEVSIHSKYHPTKKSGEFFWVVRYEDPTQDNFGHFDEYGILDLVDGGGDLIFQSSRLEDCNSILRDNDLLNWAFEKYRKQVEQM